MKGEFQFLVNGKLITYDDYNDIPEDLEFQHVIRFLPSQLEPEGEDGEHTEEQHEEMSTWNPKLQALMDKERELNRASSL